MDSDLFLIAHLVSLFRVKFLAGSSKRMPRIQGMILCISSLPVQSHPVHASEAHVQSMHRHSTVNDHDCEREQRQEQALRAKQNKKKIEVQGEGRRAEQEQVATKSQQTLLQEDVRVAMELLHTVTRMIDDATLTPSTQEASTRRVCFGFRARARRERRRSAPIPALGCDCLHGADARDVCCGGGD